MNIMNTIVLHSNNNYNVITGCWCEEVQKQLIHYLLDGSRKVKNDLLCVMVNGQRVAEDDKVLTNICFQILVDYQVQELVDKT